MSPTDTIVVVQDGSHVVRSFPTISPNSVLTLVNTNPSSVDTFTRMLTDNSPPAFSGYRDTTERFPLDSHSSLSDIGAGAAEFNPTDASIPVDLQNLSLDEGSLDQYATTEDYPPMVSKITLKQSSILNFVTTNRQSDSHNDSVTVTDSENQTVDSGVSTSVEGPIRTPNHVVTDKLPLCSCIQNFKDFSGISIEITLFKKYI